MNVSRFVSINVRLSWLVSAVLVNSAIAGTPGQPCKVQSCAKWCGSPGPSGAACWLKVSEANGPTGGPVANVDADPVCVHSDTDIFWYTLEAKSDFTVTFGTTHPFANTPSGVFKGKKVQPAGDTASLPNNSPSVCYQYSVKHCINGTCAQIDPKVIVTNVRRRRNAAH